MSNYHVKSISENERNASVIFHIPIPVENNSAGKPLRTCVSEYIDSSNFVSKVPWITAGEVTQLQTGELYEHDESVSFLAADTNLQKQTKIDDRYTLLISSVPNKLRKILKFWGQNRDI